MATLEEVSKEIRQDEFLKNLDIDVKRFNLAGGYVVHKPLSNTEDAGIYFVVSPNKDIVELITEGKVELDDFLRNQNRRPGDVFTNGFAINISNYDSSFIRTSVIDYCKNYELIKIAFEEAKCEVPYKLNIAGVDYLKQLNKLRFSTDVSDLEQKEINKSYFKVIKEYDKSINKENRLMNIFNKKRKQKITDIQELIDSNADVKFISFEEESLPAFEEYLKNYPDIQYWVSEKKFSLTDYDILNKENDETTIYRKVAIYDCDIHILDKFDLENLQNSIRMPSLDEMFKTGYSLNHTMVPDKFFDYFAVECRNKKIDFCLDTNQEILKYDGSYWPVVYYNKDERRVKDILIELNNKELHHSYVYPHQKHKPKQPDTYMKLVR